MSLRRKLCEALAFTVSIGALLLTGTSAHAADGQASASVTPKSVGNYYEIQAITSGKCLDVDGKSQANYAVVWQYSCLNADNQLWVLVYLNDGYYKFVNRNSGKCLDVNGTANSSLTQQLDCNVASTEEWALQGAGVGLSYKIVNRASGRCLDLPGGSLNDYTRIQVWDCVPGNTNQIWNFV